MGRSPCCSKVGLRRGPWSSNEDSLLTNYIQQHGEGQWRSLPNKAGLLRCGKSCRLRWMNYLKPGIKRGNITEDEEDLIVRLHGLLGNRWSLIAGRLPGRTDNEIKNYWNIHLLKKLITAGIEPKPRKDLPRPSKAKKPAAAVGKKKNKQKKIVNEVDDDNNGGVEKLRDEQAKTKVYLPKPVRVSTAFSRTNSYDSLVSRESNSHGGEPAENVNMSPVAWPPLFELDDANHVVYAGAEDLLGGGGYILPGLNHSDWLSSDVMLDEVYDYLQLL